MVIFMPSPLRVHGLDGLQHRCFGWCALVSGDGCEHGLLSAFEWPRRSDQAGAAMGAGHAVPTTERLLF
jgi:hypothetical protein